MLGVTFKRCDLVLFVEVVETNGASRLKLVLYRVKVFAGECLRNLS